MFIQIQQIIKKLINTSSFSPSVQAKEDDFTNFTLIGEKSKLCMIIFHGGLPFLGCRWSISILTKIKHAICNQCRKSYKQLERNHNFTSKSKKPTKSEHLEINEPNSWALVILEQWMENVKDPKNQVWGMHHGWKNLKAEI